MHADVVSCTPVSSPIRHRAQSLIGWVSATSTLRAREGSGLRFVAGWGKMSARHIWILGMRAEKKVEPSRSRIESLIRLEHRRRADYLARSLQRELRLLGARESLVEEGGPGAPPYVGQPEDELSTPDLLLAYLREKGASGAESREIADYMKEFGRTYAALDRAKQRLRISEKIRFLDGRWYSNQ